jgi:hypothetical protein
MRQDPHELLRRGRELLTDPQANTSQLEKALMNIHSALEQHFRDSLAHNRQVPWETRTSVATVKEVDWPQLIVLMTTYGGLSITHGSTIRSMNMIRNRIVHQGETYRGTRQDLVRYAELADSLITGRTQSFAGADMPDDLFDATMAGLGRDASSQQRAVGALPRSTPAVPAPDPPMPTQPRPVSARPRPRTTRSADDQPTVPADPREPVGGQFTTLLIVILIIVLVWLLFGSVLRGPSQLPQPTPTLGLPAGIVVRPLLLLVFLG